MNKNPFVPQPSYNPPQPPLPPGPPPAAPPDYSAYWAAAAAAAQQQPQQPTAHYTAPWTAPQPSRPPPEQSALYANYGYGGQNLHWQRQQQQPYQHAPPYNPFHAHVGFQAYPPQASQPVISQPTYQQPPQPQPPQQPRPTHGIHHTPPQNLPPAKRQRFDGPNANQQRQAGHLPPQPQFQPPPQPPNPAGASLYGHGQNQNQQGANKLLLGGGAGGGGRGKGPMGSRGAASHHRGRGNLFMSSGAGSLRGHGSRGGFGKQDFHNRRGGSFSAGHHQGNTGHGQGRGGRQDGTSSHTGNRDASMDENRRTLTDFKIIGLELPELGWTWGVLPAVVKAEEKEVAATHTDFSHNPVKQGSTEADPSLGGKTTELVPKGNNSYVQSGESVTAEVKAETSNAVQAAPPSRIRIYFHTPASADDSHPIPHNYPSTLRVAPMDSRKGKRKKLEDDDADAEEGRERPPVPHSSQMSDEANNELDGMGRASVDPSVAETASEGDWLMAAIAEDEAEAADLDNRGDDEDQLCVSQVEESQIAVIETKVLNAEAGVASDDNPAAVLDSDTVLDGAGLSLPFICREVNENIAVGKHGLPGPHEGDSLHWNSDDVTMQRDIDVVLVLPEGASGTAPEATQPAAVDDEKDNLLNSPLVESSRLASQSNASLSSSFDVSSSRASTQPATQFDKPRFAMEQSADPARPSQAQIPDTRSGPKPLQSFASLASTTAEDAQDGGLFSQEEEALSQPGKDGHSGNVIAEDDKTVACDNDQEHLPEPPASPTSNTLLSTSSGSACGDSAQIPTVVVPKRGRVPSANRLSISYAAGTRRLVVDAEVVHYLRVYRAEGRIEVSMTLEKEGDDSIKGVSIEGLSEATKSYSPLPMVCEASSADETIPPFRRHSVPSKVNLVVYLDTERPLSEPKWVKSGDVQEWLKSIFGRMFWVAGAAADGWEKKIVVADPDPAPTIWTVLEGWAVNSPVGVQTERQRFLKTHMTEADNLLEILLRLVRGERATPFSQSTPAISAPSISGPLLAALTQSTAHGAQQTHVSLAVLAIFHMAVDFAQKAKGEKGKADAEERFRNTYDSDNTVFSPQGRLHQVEYALEAVKQGSAAVGLRSKTHAILLALKRSTGELASYQQKMFRIDDHVGIAIAGLTSDARVLSNFMRQQAMSERMVFNRPMPVNRLVATIADKAQVNTQEYGRRPYGVGFLVIGQDQSGPHLFEFSPSGNSYEYFAMSIGARSQSAKTYLEKHYNSFEDCTLEELIKHGLHALRETLQQDKELNVNNTSIGIIGPTGRHEKPVSPPSKFRIIEGEPVAVYLQSMDRKEPGDGAPVAPTTADEDVQMSG
ncbi:hypothetical protein F5141DRAFT_1196464 [Pisolithus sp. B1]|nr:hypothetical protein F5141DRAFT_1196464 [Pisolithus sp. B1]